MTLDQALGIVRALLAALAGLAIGHGIAAGTYDAFGGFVVAFVTLAWGVAQHDATAAQAMSLARAFLAALGGFLVQKGYLTSDQATQIGGVVLLIAPIVWTWIVHARPNVSNGGGGAPGALKAGAAMTAVGAAITLSGCNAQQQQMTIADINTAIAVGCPIVATVQADVSSGVLKLNVNQSAALKTLALACPPNPAPVSGGAVLSDLLSAYLILAPLVK